MKMIKIVKIASPEILDEIRKEPEIKVDMGRVEVVLEDGGFPQRFNFSAFYEGQKIGNIEYFEGKGKNKDKLRISTSAVDLKYQGQGVGLWLYKQLIAYARENNFKEICSDEVVQGGALVAWQKISDFENVLVAEECEKDYKRMVEAREAGKIFKENIRNTKGSVFKLLFE